MRSPRLPLTKKNRFPVWSRIVVGVLLGLVLELTLFFAWWWSRDWHTVFILQNADEVRATGGFFGSLLLVHGRGPRVLDWEFRDVYDLDAQIGHFPAPPSAVRQYLSGGRNILHLQDANWERDFVTSVSTISDLLVAARQPRPDLVIAVNSTLIERLLVYLETTLPDYDLRDEHGTLITGQNFSTLARQDHQLTAFPRQPKTRFLRYFAASLWQTWQQAPLKIKLSSLNLLYAGKNQRLWQAYSPYSLIETKIVQIGADGRLYRDKNCNNIYFVPSNVGINKADHQTTFTWDPPLITSSDSHSSVAHFAAQITNANVFDPDAIITERQIWVDYQRLLLPSNVSLQQVTLDGQMPDVIDFRRLSDSQGQIWHEWGFLLAVPEQTTSRLQFTLIGPTSCWQLKN